MIMLIDNYDSFSFNLYQAIGVTNPDITVVRNDALSVADIRRLAPEKIVVSPGPGKPADAGICIDVIRELGAEIPILGICLGHQAIYEAYGGTVSYAERLVHGKASTVMLLGEDALFAQVPWIIQAARYHSLAGVPATLPDCLTVLAQTEAGEIMAVRHKDFPVYGLQFHPESILTPHGGTIIRNFVEGTA